jgi:hypothetical protein
VRLFAGLRSLGFYSHTRKQKHSKKHMGEDTILIVEWHDLSVDPDLMGNATHIAHAAVQLAGLARCDECATKAVRRLDFSHLASSTLTIDRHPKRKRKKPVKAVGKKRGPRRSRRLA